MDLDAGSRAAVEDFLTAYAHCIDDDDLERWPGFFHPDGLYQVISREGHEADPVSGELPDQGLDLVLGLPQPARCDVLGRHAERRVEHDDDVDPLAPDRLEPRPPLRTRQGQDRAE